MATGPGFRITAAMCQYPPLHICNLYIYGEKKKLMNMHVQSFKKNSVRIVKRKLFALVNLVDRFGK